ncbi:uncharacterized protein LOC123516296 isoform X2 [Portunus trituberculatus]|nr:uncharacterized protein LOC123516296 isoform X2 [Portunus trituberculatus]XP_045131504.1 uncharacterized protein LOC123516296 isoform X2 [Portunus trituberculatus]
MWEPAALCCFTRKTGCIVVGALEVIGTIIGLLAVFFQFSFIQNSITYMVCTRTTTSTLGTDCGEISNAVYGVMVFYMTCAAIQVLCSAMVVIGVMNDDPILITPFLIKNTIVIALNIIICIIVVVFLYLLNLLLMVAYAYCYGAIIFMWTYFLLTVRAYYYELKRGKSDDHHRLAEHCQVENGHIDI